MSDERIYAGSNMGVLITVGFNTSGIDAGELDFGLACARIEDLNKEDRVRLVQILDRVKTNCYNLWGIE
jgi:hypothetical protein